MGIVFNFAPFHPKDCKVSKLWKADLKINFNCGIWEDDKRHFELPSFCNKVTKHLYSACQALPKSIASVVI